MLRYLTWEDLNTRPRLRDTMFQDRARQFRTRLGWDVSVDEDGLERDQYDALPGVIYTIWEQPDGSHGGSMRFLPTTGRTMVDEHFSQLTQGVRISSPWIWECTRFCLTPGAKPRVAPALMLAGLDLGLASGLSHSIGVFDAPMVRVYARLGWSPAVLGTEGVGALRSRPGCGPTIPRCGRNFCAMPACRRTLQITGCNAHARNGEAQPDQHWRAIRRAGMVRTMATTSLALSDDQAEAYDRVTEVLRGAGVDLDDAITTPQAEDREAVLAVLGKAGTGKTLLLAELTQAAKAAGVEIVSGDYESRKARERRTLAILAPTNKAASVLRDRGVPATTIHRIIYTPVYDPEFEKVAEWLAAKAIGPRSRL